MTSPRSAASPAGETAPGAQVRRLADLLYVRVEAAGLTLRRVDRRLGWRRDYLSQLLRGCPKLRVSHLYAVLEALGLPPWRFFLDLFGGPERGAAGRTGAPEAAEDGEWSVEESGLERRADGGEALDPGLIQAASRLANLLERRRLAGAGEARLTKKSRAHLRHTRWTALVAQRGRRLSLLVRLTLRASGVSRAEASRRLGRGPHYLSRLLRRDPDLTLEQVYAVLATLGSSPAAFFRRLHPLPGSERRHPRRTTPAPADGT